MPDARPGYDVQPVHYRTLDFTVGLPALGVLVLGILPGLVITLVQNAAQWLIAGAG